jgi:hypothetical protein
LGDCIALQCLRGSIRECVALPTFLLLDLANQILSLVEGDGLLQLVLGLVCLVLQWSYEREGICPIVVGHELEGVGAGPGEGPLGIVIVVPIHLLRSSGE